MHILPDAEGGRSEQVSILNPAQLGLASPETPAGGGDHWACAQAVLL